MTSPFAKRIRAARKAAGLTQEEAAREAGISNMTVSRLELDKHQPDVETIKRLAKAYGTTPAALQGEDDADDYPRTPVQNYLSRVEDRLAAETGLDDEASVRRAVLRLVALEESGAALPGSHTVKATLKPGQRKRPRRPTSGE